ncbi:hypothetical protein K1719_001556 [Acacia pycnantha]|nr:hypothetical protein K1719_001556 [Acacia pycnantha]
MISKDANNMPKLAFNYKTLDLWAMYAYTMLGEDVYEPVHFILWRRDPPMGLDKTLYPQPQVCVVGYANGVLCMALDLGGSLHYFVLWNPEIKDSLTVFMETWVVQCVLGFGFNKRDTDHKIGMLSTEPKGFIHKRANARYDELHLSRFNDTRFDPLNSHAINPLEWQVCVVGYANGVLCMALDLGGSLHYFVLWNPEIKDSLTVFMETWVVQCVLGFGFNKRDTDHKIGVC